MARVVYANIIDELIGSVGGLTFQRNSSGTIVRVKPSNVRTSQSKQVNEKSQFTILANQFRQLSAGTKIDWADFAAANPHTDYWGNTKDISGMNYYMMLNANRRFLGESDLSSPPTFVAVPNPDLDTVVATNANLVINFNLPNPGSSYEYVFFASPPITGAAGFHRKDLRRFFLSIPATSQSINITGLWNNTFDLSWPVNTAADAFNVFLGCVLVHVASGLPSELIGQTVTKS